MAKRESVLSLDDQLNDINLGLDPDILLRKRHVWNPDEDSLVSADIDLLDDDIVEEEEDAAGCPLPSTPEDNQLLEAEVRETLSVFIDFLLNFDNSLDDRST